MADWGPVFIAVVLFILLTPGLLIQLPGNNRVVEFGTFQTSGASIMIHAIIYFALVSIFLVAIGVHMYVGTFTLMPNWLIIDCNTVNSALASLEREKERGAYQLYFSHRGANLNYTLNLSRLPHYTTTTSRAFPTVRERKKREKVRERMGDWAPVVFGLVLFVLLSPGLLFTLPGNDKRVEFGTFATSGRAVFVHTLLFFGLYSLFVVALDIHFYTG
ncbi:uncharacterized protein LOC144704947 [Wolffia australiana]